VYEGCNASELRLVECVVSEQQGFDGGCDFLRLCQFEEGVLRERFVGGPSFQEGEVRGGGLGLHIFIGGDSKLAWRDSRAPARPGPESPPSIPLINHHAIDFAVSLERNIYGERLVSAHANCNF
jgi:hypothetical protein